MPPVTWSADALCWCLLKSGFGLSSRDSLCDFDTGSGTVHQGQAATTSPGGHCHRAFQLSKSANPVLPCSVSGPLQPKMPACEPFSSVSAGRSWVSGGIRSWRLSRDVSCFLPWVAVPGIWPPNTHRSRQLLLPKWSPRRRPAAALESQF